MYFCVGSPRILNCAGDTQQQHPLVAVKPCGRLFAVLSPDTLSVWSGSPAVRLGSVHRDARHVRADGANCELVWRPDASQIAVITARGFVHFYSVARARRALSLQFATQHHHVQLGAGIAFSLIN